MSKEARSVPDDLALCQAIIRQQHEELLALKHQNEQLEHRLDLLLRRIYGPRSERLPAPNQIPLFEISPQDGAAVPGEPATSAEGARDP